MNILRGVVLTLTASTLLFGQAGSGTISGSVFDPGGAAVAGATVVAQNEGTGFRRESAVTSSGEFSLIGLQPGAYTVTVERQGFKKSTTKDLKLQVDQVVRLEVKLEVGDVSQVVEVTGQAALLNTEQSSTGSVVDRQKIIDFPLNGRNFVQLGLLLPGVNTGDGGSSSGGGISISGMRPEQNSFLLDGTVNSDQFQNALVIRPSVDAIEEFKIQTSSYSAEFGKGAGGQINVVTRGGNNVFHGTLFEFNRNNALQARNLFDRNPAFVTSSGKFKAPPYNQNQFGFTLGGPVVAPHYRGKDKTFFFVNYEGSRLRRGNTTLTAVPTADMKRGDFSTFIGASTGTDALGRPVPRNGIYDARTSRLVNNVYVRDLFPGNTLPASRFDSVARNMVNFPGLIPAPNIPGGRGTNGNPTQNFFDGRTRSDNYDLFSMRVDHQFSSNDTLMARYSVTDSNAFAPNTFPGYGTFDNQRQMAGTIAHTHVFGPTVVNEFKFGYLRWAQFQAGENTLQDRDVVKELGIRGLDFASTPGLRGAPNFAISGFATIGDGDGPYRPRNNTFQFIDQLSFNKGRHFIKVGGEARRVRNAITRANTLRGSFNFTSTNWTGEQGFGNTGNTFANFLLGLPVQKGRRVSGFFQDLRSTEYAGFVQDDWKVNSKLTINMGVRYMLYTPPYETQDRVSTLTYPGERRPTNYDEGALFFLVPGNQKFAPNWGRAGKELPRSLFPADKNNWGPRFGFAYRPFEKTVFRGGYGIFYDTVPLFITQDTLENLPNLKEDQQSLSLFQDGLPTGETFNGFLIANPGPGQFNPGPNDVSPNFKNAYVQHWNFGFQRELPGNILVEASYVGSKGTRLNRRENTNTAEPNGPSARVPLSAIPAQPLNPVTGAPFSADPFENAGLRSRFRRLVPYAINVWENNALYLLDNVFQTTSTAFSNYNSAQFRLEKKQSGGLTYLAAYTFSKALSDATGFNGGGPFDTGNRIQDMFNKKADKGLASIDHRQRLSVSVIYDLPFGKGKRFLSSAPAIVDKVLGGWSVNSIYTYQTGLPMTVKFNGDVFGSGTDNARPDLICNPNLASDTRTVQRYFATNCFAIQSPIRYGTAGRSTVTGPLIHNVDMGILKNTRITERVVTQFRAEFFNLPNHPQWNPPNRFIDQAAFGQINSARDPRIIQLGLKISF
jgi:Carboxypeptidase regulatory-like domain/TonB-dependent Receptor Plug Domain/TonB dependent receptor